MLVCPPSSSAVRDAPKTVLASLARGRRPAGAAVRRSATFGHARKLLAARVPLRARLRELFVCRIDFGNDGRHACCDLKSWIALRTQLRISSLKRNSVSGHLESLPQLNIFMGGPSCSPPPWVPLSHTNYGPTWAPPSASRSPHRKLCHLSPEGWWDYGIMISYSDYIGSILVDIIRRHYHDI